jgi:hypothetical protein
MTNLTFRMESLKAVSSCISKEETPGIDAISRLNAVNQALAAELGEAKPNESVLLALGLFKAEAERKAGEYQAFLDMRQRIDPND